MKCPNCGNKMKARDSFCSCCGNRLIMPYPSIQEKKKGLLVPMIIGASVGLCLGGLFLVIYFAIFMNGDQGGLAAKANTKSEEEIDSIFNTEVIVLKSSSDEIFEGGTVYDDNEVKVVMSGFTHDYSKSSVDFSILNQNDYDITFKCEAYAINGRMKYKSVGEKFLECNIAADKSTTGSVDIGRQLGEQGIDVIENMDFLFGIYTNDNLIDTFQCSVVTSKSDGDNDYVPYPYLFENNNIAVQYTPDYEGLFIANKTDEHLSLNVTKTKVNGMLVGSEYITSNTEYDILGNTKAVIPSEFTFKFYYDNKIDNVNNLTYTIEYKLDNGFSETIDLDTVELSASYSDETAEVALNNAIDEDGQETPNLDFDVENIDFRDDLTYDDFARRPNDYKYQYIEVLGEVIQLIEDDDGNILRVALNSNGYDDVIMVSYDPAICDERVLEKDYITIRGMYVGIIQYESTLGSLISVPGIYGMDIINN